MDIPKKIVILGSGFAGIYGALSVHKNCGEKVSITLINRTNYFLFTPLLHEVATGGLGDRQVVESVRKIIDKKEIKFLEADISSVDLTKKEVSTNNGIVPYDMLVVALGATTNFFGTPGAEENSLILKNLGNAVQIRNKIISTFEKASQEKDEDKKKRMLSIVVVGGGATGVEVVAEISEFCSSTLKKYYKDTIKCEDISITIVNSGPELLPVFDSKVRAYAQKILEKNKINVLLNAKVNEVTPTAVLLGDGTKIETETIIWTAGVKSNTLVTTGGELPKDKGGRIMTDMTMRVVGFPEIFALGDISHFKETSERGLPMLAQVAVGEGAQLGKNIANILSGKEPKPFLYLSKGEFVSLGKWEASGTVFGVHLYGKLAWFIWRTIYLFKFISISKRFRIAFDWTMQIFSNRDVSRIS